LIPALAVDHKDPKASDDEDAGCADLLEEDERTLDAVVAAIEPGCGCVGGTDTEVK
jgi:hypothetical protein